MNRNPIKYSSHKKKASIPSLLLLNSGFHIIFLYKDLVRLLHKPSIFIVKYNCMQLDLNLMQTVKG